MEMQNVLYSEICIPCISMGQNQVSFTETCPFSESFNGFTATITVINRVKLNYRTHPFKVLRCKRPEFRGTVGTRLPIILTEMVSFNH
jgi:hypothetical protein